MRRPTTSPRSWRRTASVGGFVGAVALVAACGDDGVEGADSWAPVTDGVPDSATGTGPGSGSGGVDATADATEGPGSADGPVQCGADEVACGQVCANLDDDPQNCGECGRTCVVANAESGCSAGNCTMVQCDAGFADCDGAIATGCERLVDCSDGSACETSCQSTGTVSCGDVCAPACAPPVETCNVADDDCDGTCDNGPIAGCRIAVHRSNGAALGHFYSTDLNEAQMPGLTLEAQNYFYLYDGAVGGLQPLFRCIKPNGKYWMTTSTDCEGTAAPEQTMGFISPDDRCGATPLFRTRNVPADAHFYTTSEAEKDNAVNNLGFADEGIAGYIFAAP